jgi:gas vesicle structural protein
MNHDDAALLRSDASLSELVNRVLDRGALISGEVVIGVAGVDLIYLGLQLAISSVESMEQREAARLARGTHAAAISRAAADPALEVEQSGAPADRTEGPATG